MLRMLGLIRNDANLRTLALALLASTVCTAVVLIGAIQNRIVVAAYALLCQSVTALVGVWAYFRSKSSS